MGSKILGKLLTTRCNSPPERFCLDWLQVSHSLLEGRARSWAVPALFSFLTPDAVLTVLDR